MTSIPVSAKGTLTNFTFVESYSSGENYNVRVSLFGSGNGTLTAISALGRQVGVPKTIDLNSTFNFLIHCGDIVTLTIDGAIKTIKSPACSNEVSNCQTPIGWVEAASPITSGLGALENKLSTNLSLENKGGNWTRYFYAVDKKNISYSDNPTDNPEKFLGVICAGTSKQNYSVVDSSGKDTGKFQKVTNKILAKELGKYSYVSSGNDYKAYFPKNAGDGFYFETKDGTKIEVVNVSIGGVKLNSKTAPSLNVDSITYYSILPDVDLVYQLDNDGVSKQLILKNANALKNNISKIEFTLAGGNLKKESPTKVKLDQKISDKKIDKNSTNVADIKKQKDVVTQLLPKVVSPAPITTDDKALNDLAATKSTELATLSNKIDNKESVDIPTELDRIDNLPVADESVSLKSGDSNLKIDLPVSYSQNSTSLLKAESVKISNDGSKLTILPDLNALKKLTSDQYPYIIDPRFYSNTGAAEDTYIGHDGTSVGSRGYQRSMIVGGRPEGGYASAYVQTCGGNTNFNGNCNIGDAQAFIKFYIPGGLAGYVGTTYLILRQYGSWNTAGFRSRIIASGNFSEGSLTYYNQPPTYGDYGYIDFTGNNVGSWGGVEDRVSSDISQYVREGNTTVVLKIMDDSAATRSATFCSKDGNVSPCYNSSYGPLLQLNLRANPNPPVNIGPNFLDNVAGCTGLGCQNSIDQRFDVGSLNDGFGNCISSNIYNRKWEKSSYREWRWQNNVGPDYSLFWDMVDRRVTDYGGGCGGSVSYYERKLGGTYFVHHQLFNEDRMYSGDSAELGYTVDTSGPVQIEANNTNIPAFKNNGNISMTLPRFIDDARSAVYFQNLEGGVIDANGLGSSNLSNQVIAYVYPSYVGGVAQQWVIESNGQIRSLADGRCLTYQGGDLQMTTLGCQFNSSYTTDIRQGYEYLPDSKQIQLINDRRWCFAKEGSALMLRFCSAANNQKWNAIVSSEPTWAGTTDKVVLEENSKQLGNYVNIINKSVQYRLVATNPIDGSWYRETQWNTNRDVTISNLINGKKYLFWMQARDRATGTANYTSFKLLGSTTIDMDAPEVSVYTQTTKIISPNNPTSVGVLDNVTFTYDYKDVNPYAAWLDIYTSNGSTLVRRLGWDPSVIPPNLPTMVAGNIRQYYQWNGKDGNGNFVPDGKYVVKAYAIDQTCNGIDYNSQQCNKTQSFPASPLVVRVDNLGANISVVLPEYNIWTNQIDYEINGGLAVLNDASLIDSTDKDVQSFFVNNNSVPFSRFSDGRFNYKYKVNLSLGVNNYSFKSVDQAGNVSTNYNQVDTLGNIIATRSVLPVNYDPVPPQINSIQDTTPAGTVKTIKNIKITFSDDRSGVNTGNIVVDLFSSTKDKVAYKISQLVAAGKTVGSQYLNSVICTSTECNLTLQNLPDGYYQLFVGVNDMTANNTCTFIQIPYSCNTLANFEKIFQVGTPIEGNLLGSDSDTSRGLNSVNVFPTYDGINSDAMLNDLSTGTRTIDQVEKVKFQIKVSQGTEAADLDFTYDTAINYPCPNAAADPTCTKRIATINNTLDTRRQYLGQNANVSTKWGSYLQEKSTITPKKCDQAECVWEYSLVYDFRFLGGFPKVVVTTYKGVKVDKQTVQWEVNGQLKGDPRVILFDKVNGTTSENANVYTMNGVKLYYTNQLTNRIMIGSDANKTYTLLFRNGATSISKTFTNDAYGSTFVDFTLPSLDGTWDIVYTGTNAIIQKFVLDRVVPTLTTVQTTNLGNPRAVMPFIRRGDNIKFDYTTSEPVWDSNLVLDGTQKVFAEKVTAGCTSIPAYTLQYGQGTQICNDAWRNSVTNTSSYQINNWQGSLQGVDGIVNPKIELVDYAGNKGSYSSTATTVNYSQTPRGVTTGNTDFRLFADSVGPDKSDFNTSSWTDGKDGVLADGINPENDRLANGFVRWVVRGTTITFTVKGEKNSRAGFVMDGVEIISNASSTNCTTGANTIVNGLIVKFAEMCDLTFNYNWTGTGNQITSGEAIDYKNFQFYTIDLSGNTSSYSNNITVYNDRTGSNAPIVSLDSPDTTKPVVDDNITRSFQVRAVEIGERMSDVVTTITSPKGVVTSRTTRQGQNSNSIGGITQIYLQNCTGTPSVCTPTTNVDNSRAETIFNLGAAANDVNFTMQGDRRVGTDDDGVYKISTKNVDTSGNVGAETIKTIERDTMPPDKPSVTPFPDEDNFSVVLKVVGEAGTTAVISGASSNEGPVANPVQGIWKGNYVYSGTYVWNVALRDRAGNMSAPVSVSYTTKAAPILTSYSLSDPSCKVTDTTKFVVPYEGQHNLNSGWGPRDLDPFHFGYDYNLAYGEKVLAAGPGTVKGVFWDTVGGGGNMVTIDHGNGLITWYAHLSQQLVKVGDKVVAGTDIARSGNSGIVTGAHLHFQVQLNGVAQDPKGFMTNCDQKPNPEIDQGITNTSPDFQGTATNPYNGKTYADLVSVTKKENQVDVFFDKDWNLMGSPTIQDTSSVITYADVKDEAVTVYGIGVPQKARWKYRIHHILPTKDCKISEWVCVGILNEEVKETTIDNSTILGTIALVNEKNLEGSLSNIAVPKDYSKVLVTDPSGRWKVTLVKVLNGKYKDADSLNILDIGTMFTLGAIKNYTMPTVEVLKAAQTAIGTVVDSSGKVVVVLKDAAGSIVGNYFTTDFSSNLNVITPEYPGFKSIDQNLFVRGNWNKLPGAYYDSQYLDARIVKLRSVGEYQPIGTPTSVNLFVTGWDPDGPRNPDGSINKDRTSIAFQNWVNMYGNKQEEFAKQQSLNDHGAINLLVEWKDASVDLRKILTKGILNPSNPFETLVPAQPTEAAKWIEVTAEEISKHLLAYYDFYKINPITAPVNCTGHSLGTLLCNEIGAKLKGKISITNLIALDPPSQLLASYNLDGRGNTLIEGNYFSKWYSNSTAYFGKGSFCGNEDLARTARVNFGILFDSAYLVDGVINRCDIHVNKIPNTFLNILQNRFKVNFPDLFTLPNVPNPPTNNILDITDKKLSDTGGVRANILGVDSVDLLGQVNSTDSSLQYVIRALKDGSRVYYGTDGNDNFNLNKYDSLFAKIFNGAGADIFNYPQFVVNHFIIDKFGADDVIYINGVRQDGSG